MLRCHTRPSPAPHTDKGPMQSFEEFWPQYVHAHRDPRNRALHYLGTTAVLGTFAASATIDEVDRRGPGCQNATGAFLAQVIVITGTGSVTLQR